MRRGRTAKRTQSHEQLQEEESECVCCSYFGLSGGRLCPTLVFAGGCVAAIAGLALTVVGAVGGSQSGFGSSAAYLVLLVVGLVLVGVGTATFIVSFLWIACKAPTRVQATADAEAPDSGAGDRSHRNARATDGTRRPKAHSKTSVASTAEKVTAWLRTAQPSPPTPEPEPSASPPPDANGSPGGVAGAGASAEVVAGRRALLNAAHPAAAAAALQLRSFSGAPAAPFGATGAEVSRESAHVPVAIAGDARAAKRETSDESDSARGAQLSVKSPALSVTSN